MAVAPAAAEPAVADAGAIALGWKGQH